MAEKIIFASDRMGKIINHLRSYSRQSNETQMKPTGVGEVIENSLILLEKQLELQNIDLEIALGSSIPYIDADSIKLESVIQNLISNSRDSFDVGQMDAKIKIASFEKDNRVGIEISDNGKGIPPEIISSIFDPFFTTKEVGAGTGLGLSICKNIVEQHGGTISIESEVGKGTSVFLEFSRSEHTENVEKRSGNR